MLSSLDRWKGADSVWRLLLRGEVLGSLENFPHCRQVLLPIVAHGPDEHEMQGLALHSSALFQWSVQVIYDSLQLAFSRKRPFALKHPLSFLQNALWISLHMRCLPCDNCVSSVHDNQLQCLRLSVMMPEQVFPVANDHLYQHHQ